MSATSGDEVALYLLRHADAGDPAEWDGDDAERPLSKKGQAQAKRLAKLLDKSGVKVDAIVSSPKLRALQTALRMSKALKVDVEIEDRLGGAFDLDALSEILSRRGGRVIVVGHDPDFSELAAELTGARFLALKKGAIARIDVTLPLQSRGGALRWLVAPELVVRPG